MSVTRLELAGPLEPTGAYSTLAVADPGQSLTWISGQVGRQSDKPLSHDARRQTVIAFSNIEKAIAEIGLELAGIIHLRTFLVGRSAQPAFIAARDETMADWFGDSPRPASTLIIVSGVADADAMVEIEAIVAGNPVAPPPAGR